jgi:hypothetical protein
MPPLIQSAAEVESYGKSIHINVKFGNIQPGHTVWPNGLIYMGATAPTDIDLDGFLYGDNLPTPAPVHLQVTIQTNQRNLELNELERG